MPVKKKVNWKALPVGATISKAGNSMKNKTGGWRTYRPVMDKSKCVKCANCWMYCPDCAIKPGKDGFYEVDYNYCKGCGICASVCPAKCIAMELDRK